MQVREIMTQDPACCGPGETIRDAALLMVENDCGEIPVVDESGKPVGVITDRDIACRCVAADKPAETPVSDAMSSPVVTVSEETSVDDCCSIMKENQLRRIVVVDAQGKCCGIVAQADVAQNAGSSDTSELVRKVSEPASEALGVS